MPVALALVDRKTGEEIGARMTYACLDPWPAAVSGRPGVRWRCAYCAQAGTQAQLASRPCPAGAEHPAVRRATPEIA